MPWHGMARQGVRWRGVAEMPEDATEALCSSAPQRRILSPCHPRLIRDVSKTAGTRPTAGTTRDGGSRPREGVHGAASCAKRKILQKQLHYAGLGCAGLGSSSLTSKLHCAAVPMAD